ncbi:MAG: GHKL domain-containing protein [Deltaproteobacteria bacterium]|nr:GHKL domain-containing protein [Deltaproteobacteria bacterium]
MTSKIEKKQSSITIFPLLTKIIVVMLIVLGGILSFVIYQESKIDLQNTLNILEQEGARLIYQIESYRELVPFLGKNDKEAEKVLQTKLLTLRNNESHVSYIQLVNNSGEEVLHAGYVPPLSSSCYNNIMFSLKNDQEVTHTYEDQKRGDIIFEIIEPIEPTEEHIKGKTLGALRLGLLLDKVRSQISFNRKSHFYNLSIFIVTILIVGIIAFYFLIARNNYLLTTSALKDAEEKNKIIMEKMKQTERLSTLGEFSAYIAHEIKNPLASIKNFTQLLPAEYGDPNFRKEFIELVTREVNRINKIVNGLLDYARPRKVELLKTNIPELVDETLSSLNANFDEHHITIKKNYNQIPPIEIDPEQIRQVLLNLILNAVEAMPDGGTIEVTIQEIEREEVEIKVSDTGCGISDEKLKEIFNPFVTTKEGGTGLGLSIVQRIVNEHGGRIEVESKKKRGTQFKLFLPIERPYSEEATDRR